MFQETREQQRQKFRRWRQAALDSEEAVPSSSGEDIRKKKDSWVVNLSTHQLTKNERDILERGLNFARAPKTIPRADIIASVESALQRCIREPEEKLERVRASVANLIRNAKPPRSNTSVEECEAIKSLRQNRDITILGSDKGNATVILDTDEYVTKAKDILDKPPFRKIAQDPTARDEKRVNDKLKQLQSNGDIEESCTTVSGCP